MKRLNKRYFNGRYQSPHMGFRPYGYVWLFRLSSFTGKLRLSATPLLRVRPTFHTGLPLLFARKLTMQSSGNVTTNSSNSGGGGEGDLGTADRPVQELFRHIPAVTTKHIGTLVEKKGVASALCVTERNVRTPSPLSGANCDDDSEAESFRDGRTEDVDRDTRLRAFAWCRDFLSGSWKTIQEDEFQISIIRYIVLITAGLV